MQKMTLRNGRTWSLYCGLVQTSSDKFGQVRTAVKRHFFLNSESHAVKIWPTPKSACSFLTVPRLKLCDPPKWWKQHFVTLYLV